MIRFLVQYPSSHQSELNGTEKWCLALDDKTAKGARSPRLNSVFLHHEGMVSFLTVDVSACSEKLFSEKFLHVFSPNVSDNS